MLNYKKNIKYIEELIKRKFKKEYEKYCKCA